MLAIPILLSSSDAIEARVTNEGSVTWRLERWMIALREAVKYPIVGIGMNNTRELFGETTGTYFSSHNSFVTFLTELGAIGFLAYLVVVGSIVRLGLRLYRQGAHPQDQWRGIVVVAVMVAYQMCALFATLLHQGDLGALYVFVFCGGIAGLYGRHHAHDSGHGRSEGVQAPLVLPRPTRV